MNWSTSDVNVPETGEGKLRYVFGSVGEEPMRSILGIYQCRLDLGDTEEEAFNYVCKRVLGDE